MANPWNRLNSTIKLHRIRKREKQIPVLVGDFYQNKNPKFSLHENYALPWIKNRQLCLINASKIEAFERLKLLKSTKFENVYIVKSDNDLRVLRELKRPILKPTAFADTFNNVQSTNANMLEQVHVKLPCG
jgi:hypothetical protein